MDKYSFLGWLYDACQLAKSGAFEKFNTDSGAANQVATIGRQLKSIAQQVPGPDKIERIRRTDATKVRTRELVSRLEKQSRQQDVRELARKRAEVEAQQRRTMISQIDAKVAALERERARLEGGAQ
ncbi:MAG: hypothetical protein ACPGJF_05630 [Sinimarinibacterium flocculans]|uniref:hypothetical protein n=1 Tax=Sinimarinibacterium flocculans TaxID=985250 RepID=UPI003C4EE50E